MAYNAYGGPGEEREKLNPMVFGTPMQPKPRDSAGAAVPPMLGANGGVNPQTATPSMAQGGAIPDGDDAADMASNAGVQDDTTASLNQALQTVNQLMMYGRKKHGLPTGESRQRQVPQQDDGGIPDDSEGGDESYAEGGAIADDIEAGRGPADTEQYGRPEVVDDPDAVRPPISGDNLDRSGISAGANEQPFSAPQGGDNSGAAPVVATPDDNSGAAPVASGAIPDGGGSMASRIISWLQGSGAAAAEVKQAEDHVHGDPAQKAAGAVAELGKQSPDAGVAAIQYNRAAYNAKAGFAYMALNGTAQKPPDLAAATKAATQATPHLLDGTLLTFAPGEGGVTASANGEKLNLTIPQFNQFLDIRKSGQYDQIFEKGGGLIALKEIMKGAGEPVGNLQAGTSTIGAPQAGRPVPAQAGAAPQAERETDQEAMAKNGATRSANMGRDVTLLRSPAYDKQYPDMMRRGQNTPERVFKNDSNSNEDRAMRAFGTVGQSQQRELYRAKLDAQDADRKAKVEIGENRNETAEKVQGLRNTGNANVQGLRNEGTEKVQGMRGDTARDVEASRSKDRQSRTDAQLKIAAEKLLQSDRAEQGRNSRAVLSASEKTLVGMAAAGQKLTPDQRKRADDLIMSKEQMGAPRAPQPSATRPNASNAPAQQISPQDQQALLWANANPNDPRAAKIKQLHGVQ